jgi:hypothetical protein
MAVDHTKRFNIRMRNHHHEQARMHELEELHHRSQKRESIANYHKEHKEHHMGMCSKHCKRLRQLKKEAQ